MEGWKGEYDYAILSSVHLMFNVPSPFVWVSDGSSGETGTKNGGPVARRSSRRSPMCISGYLGALLIAHVVKVGQWSSRSGTLPPSPTRHHIPVSIIYYYHHPHLHPLQHHRKKRGRLGHIDPFCTSNIKRYLHKGQVISRSYGHCIFTAVKYQNPFAVRQSNNGSHASPCPNRSKMARSVCPIVRDHSSRRRLTAQTPSSRPLS